MFELLAISIAFLGLIIASYYDLKTTEIPDLLPILMIAAGITLNFLNFILTKTFDNLYFSLINGIIFSIVGFSMYFGGLWGAGDAFLLSAVGFLVPKNFLIKDDLPFFLNYLTNLFLLGSIYMIFYSFFYVLKNRKAILILKGQMRKFYKYFVILTFSFLAASILLSYLFFQIINIKLSLIITVTSCLLVLVWLFSKSVERSFIKRIHVSELKVGDVLLESRRWDGLTKEEIIKIRKSGRKYVYVKSGVCFAPAFPIALVFTIFYGNSIVILFNLLSLI
jgi:Flp pilus assembly protein protease CpaA